MRAAWRLLLWAVSSVVAILLVRIGLSTAFDGPLPISAYATVVLQTAPLLILLMLLVGGAFPFFMWAYNRISGRRRLLRPEAVRRAAADSFFRRDSPPDDDAACERRGDTGRGVGEGR